MATSCTGSCISTGACTSLDWIEMLCRRDCIGGAARLLSSDCYGLELLDLLEWLFTPCWKQQRCCLCWNLSVMKMANMVLLLKVLKIFPVEDASGCLAWFLGFCCDGCFSSAASLQGRSSMSAFDEWLVFAEVGVPYACF
ncbi:hypothetical protein Nepgr_007865 [Nepenthes gracilis]|uniref:Uncharacterized protein n=1 Tax=Nepenthes gracilis TaxID=150966 RepID=A0AAD3S7N4_NEPGR|nr:hypothetical protein Nepgr_007865 [Nepenthes gracilis]